MSTDHPAHLNGTNTDPLTVLLARAFIERETLGLPEAPQGFQLSDKARARRARKAAGAKTPPHALHKPKPREHSIEEAAAAAEHRNAAENA